MKLSTLFRRNRKKVFVVLAVAVFAAGWAHRSGKLSLPSLKRADLTGYNARENTPVDTNAGIHANTRPVASVARKSQVVNHGPKVSRRATLREFMVKDLRLTPRQIKQYDQYRTYYQGQLRQVDRIEVRDRDKQIAKIKFETERTLVSVIGQRNMDSIRWWALGTKNPITLSDYLKQREAQRNQQRRLASR